MYSLGENLEREIFYITTVKERQTGEGKPFLSICFATSSLKIYSNLWDTDLASSPVQEGDYAFISAVVGEYKGNLQLKIKHIEKADGVTLEPYHPGVSFNELETRFYRLVNSIPESTESGQLLARILADKALINDYFYAPAASEMHHNFVHGLLMHSISVAEYIEQRVLPRERNIGIAVGLLHDIGKIDLYEVVGPTVRISEKGKFIDHISNGVAILSPFLVGVRADYTYPFINALLGHHGSLEHGSPILPRTAFGWLVYHADLMDSHSQHLLDIEKKPGWQGIKDKMFGLELYQI